MPPLPSPIRTPHGGGATSWAAALSLPSGPLLPHGVPVTPPALQFYPKSPGTLPVSEYYRPIYESLPVDHFKTPRHVGDLIWDSKQHSLTKSHNSYNTKSSSNDKRADPTGRSITNSGTLTLILAPTYSTKIFIGRTVMTTYAIPYVIGMLFARDSIIGIFIPSSTSLPASLFTRSVMHHPPTNSLVTLLARLLMMCIIERAQRYLSNTRSDKS